MTGKHKFCVLVGTRPEIIKLSALVKLFQKEGDDFFIIHSGQHYSYNLDRMFFQDLQVPDPRYNLEVGSKPHASQIGEILIKLDQIIQKEKPDVIFVQGDTNTVLAGALAGSRNNVLVAHVEAGLRSYDKRMPEEANRILADHESDLLFAPTELQKEILQREKAPEERVHVVGNTIVDAVLGMRDIAEQNAAIKKQLPHLEKNGFIFTTIHRQENVDNKETFQEILNGLGKLQEKFNKEIIYPIHPRAKKRIEEFNLNVPGNITLLDPINYLDCLFLQNNAALVATDSGGLQEEACILQTPCITVRKSTERPETVEVGANKVAGTSAGGILQAAEEMMSKERNWQNPFGDGTTSQQILNITKERLARRG